MKKKNVKRYYAIMLVVFLVGSICSSTFGFSAPADPVVTTNPATGIGDTSATLKGFLNEDGWDVWFTIQEQGENEQNVDPDGPWKRNSGSFSMVLTNLKPSTQYTFWAKADNNLGRIETGDPMSFETTGTPINKPTVRDTGDRNVGETWIALKTYVDDDGGEDCRVHLWCVEEERGYTSPPSYRAGEIYWNTFLFLDPETTYTFKAWASNSAGDGQNQTVTISTKESTITPPTVSSIDTISIGKTYIEIESKLNIDGGESCRCKLECEDTEEVFESYHESLETFSHNFSSLTPGEYYDFRACANNSAGYSDIKTKRIQTESEEEENIQLSIDTDEIGLNSVKVIGTLIEGEECTCQISVTGGGEGTRKIPEEIHSASTNPAFEHTFTDLTPGTGYIAYVKAWKDGISPESEQESFETLDFQVSIKIDEDEIGTNSVRVVGTLIEGEELTCKLYIAETSIGQAIDNSDPVTRSASSNPNFYWTFEDLEQYENYYAWAEASKNGEVVAKSQPRKRFQTKSGSLYATLQIDEVEADSVKLTGTLVEAGGKVCTCELGYIKEGGEKVWERFVKSEGNKFSHTFGNLISGTSYNAYVKVWYDGGEEQYEDSKPFTTEEITSIIKYCPEEVNENEEFTIETFVAADFTYDGETVKGVNEATFRAPYYENIKKGEGTISVTVRAENKIEIAEIRVIDYLELEFTVDKAEVVEGSDLTVTVKDQGENNLEKALVIVKNGNSAYEPNGGTMEKDTDSNGQVTFSKEDYKTLNIDKNVDCEISVEKEGYDVPGGSKSITVKNAFLKIVSPSEGASFHEFEDVTVEVWDQDGNPFARAKVELTDSHSEHIRTDDEGKATIRAPSVIPEKEGATIVTATLTVQDPNDIYEGTSINLEIINKDDYDVKISITVGDGRTSNPTKPLPKTKITIWKGDGFTQDKEDFTDDAGVAEFYVYPDIDGTHYSFRIEKDGYTSKISPSWIGELLNVNSGEFPLTVTLEPSSYLDYADDVEITYSPLNPKVGDKIYFNAECKASDDSIDVWYWDFGDLENSNERNPEHTYESEGKYRVTLLIVEDDNDIHTYSIDIIISADDGNLHLVNLFTNFVNRLRGNTRNPLSFLISKIVFQLKQKNNLLI